MRTMANVHAGPPGGADTTTGSTPGSPTGARWRPRRLRDMGRAEKAGLIGLLAVLAVTGIRVVVELAGRHAVVVGDEALIARFAHDVLADRPTVGKVTSAVLYGNGLVYNPGPAESLTLWPFVSVLGMSLGSFAYAYVVNVGAAVVAGFAGFRRGGSRLGLLVFATCLLMFAFAAPGQVSSVLNTRIILLPMFASLVLAAAVILGDTALLPVQALLVSFVVQIHIGYAPVAVAGLAVAVAVAVLRGFRGGWVGRVRGPLVLTLVVLFLCWALPLHDQFSGTGNLGRLLHAEVPSSGLDAAGRAVAAALDPRVLIWRRGELGPSAYASWSWVGLLLLATAIVVLVATRGRWLRRNPGLALLLVACLAAAGLTAGISPPTDTGGEHYYWLRAVGFFVPLALVMAWFDAAGDSADKPPPRWSYALVGLLTLGAIAPPCGCRSSSSPGSARAWRPPSTCSPRCSINRASTRRSPSCRKAPGTASWSPTASWPSSPTVGFRTSS